MTENPPESLYRWLSGELFFFAAWIANARDGLLFKRQPEASKRVGSPLMDRDTLGVSVL